MNKVYVIRDKEFGRYFEKLNNVGNMKFTQQKEKAAIFTTQEKCKKLLESNWLIPWEDDYVIEEM